MKISDKTHEELMRIVGELTAMTGKRHSFDDAIKELIKGHRARRAQQSPRS